MIVFKMTVYAKHVTKAGPGGRKGWVGRAFRQKRGTKIDFQPCACQRYTRV